MRLLDLQDNKLIISPEALALTFFSDLWQRDKSKDKTNAYKDITFVYYYGDFGSPFFSYPEEDRTSMIKEFVVGEEYKPDAKVLRAIEDYKKLTTTPGMRQLEAAYIALSKTEQYLKGVDYSKMDENGRFLYDPDKVQKIIINMPKLQEALNQAKDICVKELSSGTKVRGNANVGQFED